MTESPAQRPPHWQIRPDASHFVTCSAEEVGETTSHCIPIILPIPSSFNSSDRIPRLSSQPLAQTGWNRHICIHTVPHLHNNQRIYSPRLCQRLDVLKLRRRKSHPPIGISPLVRHVLVIGLLWLVGRKHEPPPIIMVTRTEW